MIAARKVPFDTQFHRFLIKWSQKIKTLGLLAADGGSTMLLTWDSSFPSFLGVVMFAYGECVIMQTAEQQTESTATDRSLETGIETNVHELKSAGATFRQTENDSAEIAAANNLAALLDRVSDVTTREIENLVSELRGLREKLKTDCDRIQGDVAKYAELSQAVNQLTTNISDSVVSLPSAPGIIP